MPGRQRGGRSRLGSLGTIRSFVAVLREMSFDEVRDGALTPPRLATLAPTKAEAEELAHQLVGNAGESVVARALADAPRDLDHFDALVVLDPDQTGVVADLRRRVQAGRGSAAVFGLREAPNDDAHRVEGLRREMMTRLPEHAPAFGRAFPPFRAAATSAVVDETAKANAQFALVSNIPAVIPLVGSLAAAGADFLVLTKNQLMMLFKVAAIHGRDLHDQWGIMQEMVPVVGAGLLWRTIAREAASFVPLAAGTLPKVAIAYAGTLSAGARAATKSGASTARPPRRFAPCRYRSSAGTTTSATGKPQTSPRSRPRHRCPRPPSPAPDRTPRPNPVARPPGPLPWSGKPPALHEPGPGPKGPAAWLVRHASISGNRPR